MVQNDTIAAIATPYGSGGIGIIRISGPDSIAIAERIFTSAKNKKIADAAGYSALYGRVHSEEKIIDEAVALIFKAPASYTGEDVVELSMHGGMFILKEVLRCAVANGARLAEGGEFTKRAFLNGKLDLTQAESVMQLINARSENERLAALNARNGSVSKKISEIKAYLLKCASDLAAFTDYPDEDMPDLESGVFKENLESAQKMLESLIKTYDDGKLLRDGIDTVIIGRPNVGKSTLMNSLLGENRSIVTDVAGTTRDIVEESAMIGDVCLKLSDTAGIRETNDIVESIGVERSRSKLESAQLILIVLDSSSELQSDDIELLENCKNRNALVLVNKSDLEEKIDMQKIKSFGLPTVSISAVNDDLISLLSDLIGDIVTKTKITSNSVVLLGERQHACAIDALTAVKEAERTLDAGFTLDAVGVCLDDALAALMSLTGERVTTAVADEVFSRFCVGK